MIDPWFRNRILQALLTIYVVISLAFVLVRFMPGGPMAFLKAQLVSSGDVQERRRLKMLMDVYMNIRPDQPLWKQYINYVIAVFKGDLGTSITYQEPVASILARVVPWTVFVMSISITLTWVLGVVIGAMIAYIEGSLIDMSVSTLAVIVTSVPYYVFAVLFVFVFANLWGVFPAGGRYDALTVSAGLNLAFIKSVFYHAAMPITSLVIAGWGGAALGMRGNSISVLGEDYLRVGEIRGLSDSRLALQYIGKNAVLPLYTRLMISIGFMFGGSILLETIFRYEGVGFVVFRAINRRDYPLMMGGFLIITIAVVIGIFIADLTYGKIDPRISAGERS